MSARTMRRLAATLGFSFCLFGTVSVAGAVKREQVRLPDGLEASVWSPAKLSGRMPLVILSHGTAGSMQSHEDTAVALAEAGFVAVAVLHTGDNYQDQSRAGNRVDLVDRPRQITRLIDYLLAGWPGHATIDARHIGIFGFSLGGFTSLVTIGAVPELSRIAAFCAQHSDAPECRFIRDRGGDQLAPAPAAIWARDDRVKAAVVAAPALGFVFSPESLGRITIPMQLWRADEDEEVRDAWNTAILRKGVPRIEEHVVHGGHYIFLAPCSPSLRSAVPAICVDAAGIDRAEVHRAMNRAIVAFFRQTFIRR